jgi:hypothetical protein
LLVVVQEGLIIIPEVAAAPGGTESALLESLQAVEVLMKLQ